MAVIRNDTKKAVAFYHNIEDPYNFAESVNLVGRYYNNARVAVESNKDGLYVNDRLVKDFSYPNLYMQ